jgi:hypothetical protein
MVCKVHTGAFQLGFQSPSGSPGDRPGISGDRLRRIFNGDRLFNVTKEFGGMSLLAFKPKQPFVGPIRRRPAAIPSLAGLSCHMRVASQGA